MLMGTRPHHRRRAFTLLEVIVASTIAFILVGAAAEMSSAMGRSVRKIESQADLGVRTAIAHGFMQRELAPMAFNWNTTNETTGLNTGSFGPGNCAISSGVCNLQNGAFFPIRLCKSSTVTSTICDAPSATEADAVVSYMPRDPVVESMVVRSKGDGLSLPADCTSFTTNPASLRVAGTNTVAWSDGDLVLVSRANHASIGVLKTNLAVHTSATIQRTIAVDLGRSSATAGLALDDGGRTASCSARDSLLGASIIRIKQVILTLDEKPGSPTFRNLMIGVRNTSAGPLIWSTVIPDVDDLQFQFEMARVDASSKTGSFCTSDTSDLFAGGTIPSCGGPLVREANATAGRHLIRVLGLRAGFTLRSSIETEPTPRPWPLIFNRTGPTGSDRRARRLVFMFLGTPNAMQ